jgi:hypothetical protein
VLFDVATSAKVDKKYQIRALRGYIRLMRQFPMPARDRSAMCQKALDAASRADEQKLVLEVLERYPSGDTLRLAAQASAIPAVKQEANRVAAAIAQKLGGPSASVQDMLAKAGREPVKVEILKAVYGSGEQQKDVTEQMQNFVGSSPLVGLPKATYNENFGGDPAPSAKKVLHVEYRIANRAGAVSLDENAPIVLPTPKYAAQSANCYVITCSRQMGQRARPRDPGELARQESTHRRCALAAADRLYRRP